MSYIRSFLSFLYDFIIGDDWTVAASVLVGLLVTWGLVRAGLPAWWLLPVVAVGSTVVSLRRATSRAN